MQKVFLIIHRLKEIVNKQFRSGKLTYIFGMLLIVLLACLCLISNNESCYQKTVAKITSVTEETIPNTQNNRQTIQAIIMNGKYMGKEIKLENTISNSQALDSRYNVNDELFINLQDDKNKQIISSEIIGFKRDNYIAYVALIFAVLILLIAQAKGLRSLLTLIMNIIIASIILQLYLHGYNLIVIASIASFLFILTSLIIVSGINKKTLSAILSTIVGTLISILLTIIIFKITDSNGIHYEEMEFLTTPPEPIFISEILLGTLGAIMDIAITISSSIEEIYKKNPFIEKKLLLNSAMEIGKDIMGTMTNTLVLAYFSGSIPMILLWLKNDYPFSEIININLSLEIIRILTGSIGIVISIPITIYISSILLKKQTIGLSS
ncbi:YibE/F family protein [Desulfosporosinus sp. FKB]|uniref:YibE/F family protein n=1 Tax=Desulfosporosinus sp. FKB TaxID=1969835 RepID=UPI000B49A266|nr:YibE/F family protein [Desulfosporosinus sp. FKB]